MPTTLFHGTNREFESFDETFIGSQPGNAGNSALGIWFATTSDWIDAFGRRVIEAEVELGRSYPMTVRTLFELSTRFSQLPTDGAERSAWLERRQDLLNQGYDSISIAESDGRVAMHVVLRVENILSMRDIKPLMATPSMH